MKSIISIWMQPVYGRLNAGSLKPACFILALIYLIPFVEMIFATGFEPGMKSILQACISGLGSVLLTMLIFWFISLVPSVIMQYTPACAILVPHMKRRMQAALVLPVLLMPLLFPLALRMHGKFSQGWFLGVLAMLIYVATIRHKWVIILIILTVQLPGGISKIKMALATSPYLDQPVLFVVAGLAFTAVVVRWFFFMYGDQHFKIADSIPTMRQYMRGEEAGMNLHPLKFLNPYQLLLRLCLDRVRAAPEKVRQLLPFAIGSQAFWLSNFIPVVIMGAGLSIYFVFFFHDSAKNEATDNSIAYFAALVSFILLPPIYAAVARSSICQRKEEQGLLLLAPRLPSRHEQGKVMLYFILRQYLSLWLVSAIISLSAAYLSPASEYMHEVVWLITFSLLPVSVLSLTNYAQIQSSYQSAALAALGILALVGLTTLGLHALIPALPVWLICALIVVATAVVLRQRWQRLMRVDALLPVGRAV